MELLQYHLAATTELGVQLPLAELRTLQTLLSLIPNERTAALLLGVAPSTARNQLAASIRRAPKLQPPLESTLLDKQSLVLSLLRAGLVRRLPGGQIKPDFKLAPYTGKRKTLEFNPTGVVKLQPYKAAILKGLVEAPFSGMGYLANTLNLSEQTVRNELGAVGRMLYQTIYHRRPNTYVDTRFLATALLDMNQITVSNAQ